MFSLKFSDQYVKAWVISVDCVDVAFEATAASEPMTTLKTGEHGAGPRRLESKLPALAESDAPAFVEVQRRVGMAGKVPVGQIYDESRSQVAR